MRVFVVKNNFVGMNTFKANLNTETIRTLTMVNLYFNNYRNIDIIHKNVIINPIQDFDFVHIFKCQDCYLPSIYNNHIEDYILSYDLIDKYGLRCGYVINSFDLRERT